MRAEYFTEAVVLDKEAIGEFDALVYLYTQQLGRIRARVTSARKITSKLNGHLEPLNLVQLRLVEKNRFQIADVLKTGSLPVNQFKVLRLIKTIAPEAQPDGELWRLVTKGDLTEDRALKILGFDKQFAACQRCEGLEGLVFSTGDLAYFCRLCLNEEIL